MRTTENPSPELRRAVREYRRRNLIRASAVAGAMAAIFILLGLVLGPLSWLFAGGPVRRLAGKDQADALNAVRQTLLAALAGTATLGGVAFTARTYFLSRRGQVTDRFSKAIQQLASNSLEERLGGIYALEHIMAESARDHATIIEVLCAFVRTHAPKPVGGGASVVSQSPRNPGIEPDADIDAVMTVLARRPRRPEPNRPDLRHVSLIGLSLRMFEFPKTPNLTRVFLTGADLSHADLRGLDLSRTILTSATLRGALVRDANFTDARLCGADLQDAGFLDCVMTGADLTGTDLSGTRGLTAEQLSETLIDAKTILPAPLDGDPWVAARLAACQAWLNSPAKPLGQRGPAATPPPILLPKRLP